MSSFLNIIHYNLQYLRKIQYGIISKNFILNHQKNLQLDIFILFNPFILVVKKTRMIDFRFMSKAQVFTN